jgi:biotin/methionine sulfoxide reductase
MPALVPPYAEARDDHAIMLGLAERLGIAEEFAGGRTPLQWLEELYTEWAGKLARRGASVPSWQEFWETGRPIDVPMRPAEQVMLAEFRADPGAHPLRTPSGRIQLTSPEIAAFGYPDCPGVPTWFAPAPDPALPLVLLANQPKTRLHSQLDVGGYSRRSKIQGREPVRMHPSDAAVRGIAAGDMVRLRNDKGWVLAGAVLTEAVSPGVVQLSTGAWYDPDDDGNCVHGNPNVLTTDVGSSALGQGTTGGHIRVEVELFVGEPPPLSVLAPPPILAATPP